MPEIRVLAGSNGSGKSTFTDIFSKENSVLFHFDKAINKITNNNPESLDKFKDHTRSLLESSIQYAKDNNSDLSIVTSYNHYEKPIVESAVKDLKKLGYGSSLIYFHLESVEDSMIRVAHRSAENGFDIDDSRIETNYKESKENFRFSQGIYDKILLVDNSISKEIPKLVVRIENDKVIATDLDSNNKTELTGLIDGYTTETRQRKL